MAKAKKLLSDEQHQKMLKLAGVSRNHDNTGYDVSVPGPLEDVSLSLLDAVTGHDYHLTFKVFWVGAPGCLGLLLT